VTLTFAEPINVAGQIPINVATLTRSTQTVVSPTVVTVLMSGALTGHAWTLASPVPETSTYTGGVVLGGSGTF
jgi:nucleoside recognition membrane protein YjiH